MTTKSPSASSHPIKRVHQILAGKLFDRHFASNQVITIDCDVGIVLDIKSELEVDVEALENEFGQNIEDN